MIPMPPAAQTVVPRVALNVWHGPLALQFAEPDAADAPPLTVEVLPPPTADGRLPTRDGRDWTVAGDMAALAAAVKRPRRGCARRFRPPDRAHQPHLP